MVQEVVDIEHLHVIASRHPVVTTLGGVLGDSFWGKLLRAGQVVATARDLWGGEKTLDIDVILDILHRRRSIRRFKTDPIPQDYIDKILEAGRWAMSGNDAQPWEFVVVRDPSNKAKMAEIMHQRSMRTFEIEQTRREEFQHPDLRQKSDRQKQATANAAAIVVVCGDPRTIQASVLAPHFFGGEQDLLHMDLANASMLMHLAAAALGLGSAWQSTDRPAELALIGLLGIPPEFRIYNLILLGYPAYQPGPSGRRELSEMVHLERYDMSKYRTDPQIREWLATHHRRRLTGEAHAR